MQAHKETKAEKPKSCKPQIKTSGSKTMLTYSLNSLYDLGQGVKQVTHLLQKLAPKHEYLRVKQETLIRAEKNRSSDTEIILHFIIPK